MVASWLLPDRAASFPVASRPGAVRDLAAGYDCITGRCRDARRDFVAVRCGVAFRVAGFFSFSTVGITWIVVITMVLSVVVSIVIPRRGRVRGAGRDTTPPYMGEVGCQKAFGEKSLSQNELRKSLTIPDRRSGQIKAQNHSVELL